MEKEQVLAALCLVLALGVTAQWIAWRLRVPAILTLLLLGFAAGPATGVLDPDALMGKLLFPFVSMAVAIILFEGGMNLRLADLGSVGKAVRNLVTAGAFITMALTTVAARLIFDFDVKLSLLLGAMLIVTGPTVIVPLLRQVRLSGRLSTALRWEGILSDPIGAITAVLIFQAILAGTTEQAAEGAVLGLLGSVAGGAALGAAGAVAVGWPIKRYLVPDYLQSPIALMFLALVYVGADHIQAESGLLAATVMGMVLANIPGVSVKAILAFKENLQVLLIGTLFILLGARLKLEEIMAIGVDELLFLAVLIVVVRPAAALVSLLGTELTWRERLMAAWIAPRGIVAATVAAIFALQLREAGYASGPRFTSIMFLTIFGTIAVYGLSARPVARLLGVMQRDPQGALFVGAHAVAQTLAQALKDEGFETLLVDTNRGHIAAARMAGLRALQANALSDAIAEDEMEGIGMLLAVTPNNSVNALIAVRFGEIFGKENVFQLAPPSEDEGGAPLPVHLRGRFLFAKGQTYDFLAERVALGAYVKKTRLSDQFSFEDFQKTRPAGTTPLFLITAARELRPFALDATLRPAPGDTIVSLTALGEER